MTPIHLPIPHLQQHRVGECLAACAQMVLVYLNILVTYEHLLKLLQVKSGFWTPAANIRHLETLNLQVSYQQFGTFEDLYNHLRQGHPCIVFVKTGELSYWDENIDHAMVVVGLDSRYIYLNDPAFSTAPMQIEQNEFDLAWLDWDEKYAVVTPPA